MTKRNIRDLTKSNAHFKSALKRLPLGVASTFRYWGDDRTIYVHHGKGGRTWDIDDNCYVDYRLGYGPAILGYADERVDAAAIKGMEVGGVFALSTERELIVADRMAKMVPGIDLVRYSNSGTEAVMAALRLARAYTGKDSYILIEGGYHGLFDAAMWMAKMDDWNPESGLDPVKAPYSQGVPQRLKDLVYLTPMNDINRLEDIFKKSSEHIGAMLIEPMMGNCCAISATTEFVKAARDLCDKYGVLLIIDEVKTGFRVARGGIQSLHGVVPDISTFAKAMANGYPISALVGTKRWMQPIAEGKVVHAGTVNAGNPSVAAAMTTLDVLERDQVHVRLHALGNRLKQGLIEAAQAAGQQVLVQSPGPMLHLAFTDLPYARDFRDTLKFDKAKNAKFIYEMQERGVRIIGRGLWYISAAHTEADIDHAVAVAAEVLKQL